MKLKYIFFNRCCERGLKLTFFSKKSASAIFYQSMDYNFIFQSLGSLSFTFPGTANGRFELSWQNFR